MKTKNIIGILLSLTAISTAGLVDNINIPTKGSDLKITVYNSNIAFVDEERKIVVPKGKMNLVYEGVPRQFISESVIPTFSKSDISLYSQNYVFNTISSNSLLENSINKEVEFYKNGYEEEENPLLNKGILLSKSPILVKNKEDNKIYTLSHYTQVVFNDIPKDMITKPSLVWEIENAKEGLTNINLKYLTTGISWKSDYVLDLNKDFLNLKGWITINNKSGVTYEDAQITCLAGEVNRVRNIQQNPRIMQKSLMADSIRKNRVVKEESFSGYHLYKIPFKQTILNNQKKQIAFIDKKNVSYEKYGLNENSYFENYGKQKMSFRNIIEFKNSKDNGLGIPLPTGAVRMYSKDKKGNTHFIGEDRVRNAPVNEKIKLKIGTLFDVVGDKTITKFKADRYKREVETTYEIRNRGKEEVEVRIRENIPVYGRRINHSTSCTGICSYEEESAFIRIYKIKLNPKKKYKFKTYFKVNY